MDTSGFFALLVGRDAHHGVARELFERASEDHWGLVTSNVVVAETHALLLARLASERSVALAFLESLDESSLHVEFVGPSDHEAATQILRKQADKSYSLCDTLSFVLMRRLDITEAIAFDQHFQRYGQFTIL